MPHPFSGGTKVGSPGKNINLKPDPGSATEPLRRYVCLPERILLPSSPILSGEFDLDPGDLTLIIQEPWDEGVGSIIIIDEPWEFDPEYEQKVVQRLLRY